MRLAIGARGPRPAARPRVRRPRHDPRHRERRIRRARRPLRAALAATQALDRELWPQRRWSRVGDEDRRRDRPLRLLGTRLYLDRYWREERRVAARPARNWQPATRRTFRLDVLADGIARLFSGDSRRAPAVGRRRRGPAPLRSRRRRPRHRQDDDRRADRRAARRAGRGARIAPAAVALAAPTGKAAARLQEAVHEEAVRLAGQPSRSETLLLALSASTLHRLLGWRPGKPQPLRPRPRQPPAARRRDRRRDLDGLAVADGHGSSRPCAPTRD